MSQAYMQYIQTFVKISHNLLIYVGIMHETKNLLCHTSNFLLIACACNTNSEVHLAFVLAYSTRARVVIRSIV
jgi:hypothetical protein